MKTRPRHPVTATICMLAAVLVLSNAAQTGAVIVCVGSDYPVDVESSVCTCCAVTVSHYEKIHAEMAPASSACIDCVDVPLRVPTLNSKAPELSFPHINTKGRTIVPICSGSSKIDLLIHRNQMDQRWQSLCSLSTVAILI